MSDPEFKQGDKVKFFDYGQKDGVVIMVGQVMLCYSEGVNYDNSMPYYAVQAIDLKGNIQNYPSMAEERLHAAADDEVTRLDSPDELITKSKSGARAVAVSAQPINSGGSTGSSTFTAVAE